ncbi:hypothetical protein [Bradyrhizobium ottawaense]|uniref:hypothetical protein n=1 Tax=Bradyrhizobium ottawaense TaxID=931866 RepID=UPI00351517FF
MGLLEQIRRQWFADVLVLLPRTCKDDAIRVGDAGKPSRVEPNLFQYIGDVGGLKRHDEDVAHAVVAAEDRDFHIKHRQAVHGPFEQIRYLRLPAVDHPLRGHWIRRRRKVRPVILERVDKLPIGRVDQDDRGFRRLQRQYRLAVERVEITASKLGRGHQGLQSDERAIELSVHDEPEVLGDLHDPALDLSLLDCGHPVQTDERDEEQRQDQRKREQSEIGSDPLRADRKARQISLHAIDVAWPEILKPRI